MMKTSRRFLSQRNFQSVQIVFMFTQNWLVDGTGSKSDLENILII